MYKLIPKLTMSNKPMLELRFLLKHAKAEKAYLKEKTRKDTDHVHVNIYQHFSTCFTQSFAFNIYLFLPSANGQINPVINK